MSEVPLYTSAVLVVKATPSLDTRSFARTEHPAVLSTEGRVVGLCWEHLKPKGPKGSQGNSNDVSQHLSEADSYLRLIDFVYHSTLGLKVIKKKSIARCGGIVNWDSGSVE